MILWLEQPINIHELKSLKIHELPGNHQGLALNPQGALRRPRPPAYFGLSLYVHITSRLATPLPRSPAYFEMSLCVHITSILATCMPLLRAVEHGEIFIVPHVLWHGTSVFPVSSPLTTHKRMCRTYSNPDPHGSRLVEYNVLILNRIQRFI
jgi:hypothetical protein